jgi:hypothetical protein
MRSVEGLCKEAGRDQRIASHVEVGSNTTTVAQRVVGGDKKRSLESETVTENECAGEGQQQL